MIKNEFEPDDASNVVDPSDPKTGNLGKIDANVVGPEDPNHPGRYLRGPDFMKEQIQLGAHVIVGSTGEEFVCKSDGSIYEAYWDKVVD